MTPFMQAARSGDSILAFVPDALPAGTFAAHTLARATAPEPLTIAAFLDEPTFAAPLAALQRFATGIGTSLTVDSFPIALARAGTIGRIGVPREAIDTMIRQQIAVAATLGGDPLSPASRLWRGLQRRADVMVDLRQCITLPGSTAAIAGHQRDVLLFSQRNHEGPMRGGRTRADAGTSAEWSRARRTAEMAYAMAAAENRTLLYVTPVGRGTHAKHLLADALVRQARVQRMASPRTVKAGLLSALLSGEHGRERWLVVSTATIAELSAMVTEAIGETGPWPVVSVAPDVVFLDMPAASGAQNATVSLLLVIATLLQRQGNVALAQRVLQSLDVTASALLRMHDELGYAFDVPAEAFLAGVASNLGRGPATIAAPLQWNLERDDAPVVAGLRLRIETALPATTLRETISAAVMPTGLEVASVRSVEGGGVDRVAVYDVRVRGRLGEGTLSDAAALALTTVLGNDVRCVSVDPWIPGSLSEKLRLRTRIH